MFICHLCHTGKLKLDVSSGYFPAFVLAGFGAAVFADVFATGFVFELAALLVLVAEFVFAEAALAFDVFAAAFVFEFAGAAGLAPLNSFGFSTTFFAR
jgi:hypothetical protein